MFKAQFHLDAFSQLQDNKCDPFINELAAHVLTPFVLSAARCEQCRFVSEMIA